MTAGWGETEVFMDVSSRRLALVQHRHLPARGLLSVLRLLSAFLLNAIKRNQAFELVVVHTARQRATAPSRARNLGRAADGNSRGAFVG